MKKLLLLTMILTLNLMAEDAKSACNTKSKADFETTKATCKEKAGEEKKTCIKDAVAKLKDANAVCKETKKACIEKAKAERDAAQTECKTKKAEEKKACFEPNKVKFQEAKAACQSA